MTRAARRHCASATGAAATALLAALMCGCASSPTLDELRTGPAPHLTAGAPPVAGDDRGRFRQLFCAALGNSSGATASARPCDFWLHRLADEPAPSPSAIDVRPPRLQVLLMTGAFSECFGDTARPFDPFLEALRRDGMRIDTVVLGGRSGTADNARQIADYLGNYTLEPGVPLVMIGYSKGVSDILEFLVGYPDLAAKVAAVVGVAGAVRGSPLADALGGPYWLLFHVPIGQCPSGNGDVIHSLRTDVRRAWLQQNSLPEHVRYYSLTAFATRDRMARALVAPWKKLLHEDRRNDGQLLPGDTLIPNSTVLGYLNADHWGVALDIEREHALLADRPDAEPFPQQALLDSILRLVGQDLYGAVGQR